MFDEMIIALKQMARFEACSRINHRINCIHQKSRVKYDTMCANLQAARNKYSARAKSIYNMARNRTQRYR